MLTPVGVSACRATVVGGPDPPACPAGVRPATATLAVVNPTRFVCRRCGRERWSSSIEANRRPWLCAVCIVGDRTRGDLAPGDEPNAGLNRGGESRNADARSRLPGRRPARYRPG